ncbi:DUF2971 domain-containing protein [Brachyspira pilosicoli]|uniref:Uncharacterized protein n=1 Tax=Brachyspira pilosicoli (strain ATCC BAA-1826 / 95/1000) TaxID=759914 RepID=D8IBN2_BRAP9|nr:DUF2971 domain-containing protein [Brachyspira pilosicoli]ADK30555.1 conserved hypothetical protein [Brachyspira pilosicoli 95/1000]
MNLEEIFREICKLVEEDKFDHAYFKCIEYLRLANLSKRDKSELFILLSVVTIVRFTRVKDMVYSMSIPFHINDLFQNILLTKNERLIYLDSLYYLDSAIKTDDSNIKAYLYRGIIKHNLLFNKEAVNDFKKVIDSNSKEYLSNKLIYGFMAYNLYYIGEYEEALKCLDIVLPIDNEIASDIFNNIKINCLINLEKYNEALDVDKKNNKEESQNPYILNNRAFLLYKTNNNEYKKYFKKSVDLFRKYIEKFPMNINSASIIFNLLRVYGEIDKNDLNIIDSILKEELHYGINYEKLYEELKDGVLYKYTKINENVFSMIENNEIWLTNPCRFNDPVDPFIKIYNNMYKYLMDRVKIACLGVNNNNTLMWSHYADKHEGICIGYDIKDPNLYKDYTTMFKIIYDMEIVNLNNFVNTDYCTPKNLSNIREEDLENYTETLKLFLYKSKEWAYENEYRILKYDELGSSNGISKPLKIKSICFGANINKYYKKIIIDIVKDTDIKLYEAKFDNLKPYKMNIYEYKC